MDQYELGVAMAVAHLAELHRQADRRRPTGRLPGRTRGRHRDLAPGSPRRAGRHGCAAAAATAASGPQRATEEAAMLTEHHHEPGVFDAGHCWGCARQAGLLDHYRRVQREEARLQETRVQGVLEPRWSGWFEGLQVSSDDHGETTTAGAVADQAALHGLLAKIRDLGLPLLEIPRLDPDR
jgi:hypothetical protein